MKSLGKISDPGKTMQCKCGGVLIDGKSTYRKSSKNFTFILENVPAYKCMRCDEVQYSEETKDKLQNMINRLERESNEIVTGKPSSNLYDY
jgi:YgiT-type zinc finger domain-containing protein